MRTLQTLLVGSHFRPPAKQLLACAPSGIELTLVPEYDNPYDENAIKAMLDPSLIPESQFDTLRESLDGTGFELEELLDGEAVQVGYVAKSGGKPLAGTNFAGNVEFREVVDSQEDYQATLGFAPDGKPMVILTTGLADG